ncbi:MAG: excisionase family DNA-binding protein [Candidatus Omnitrophota bacterium]
MNIREAAEYLGVGERAVKELVDKGSLPAYKIGGTFLRFKKSQLDFYKANLESGSKAVKPAKAAPSKRRAVAAGEGNKGADAIKDFLYFNDFYIFSFIVIVIAVTLMIAT